MTLYYLLLATIIGTTVGVEIEPRNFDGYTAFPGEFPSIVSIHNHLVHWCAGSIYSKNWVVTAAHCLVNLSSSAFIVSGTTLKNYGDKHRIVDWVIHEEYDDTTLRNDIGLIKVENDFEFDYETDTLSFIDLQEDSIYLCLVAGWGRNENDEYPKILQFIQERVLPFETCKRHHKQFDEGQICSIADGRQGICDGDSGGPLVCNGKLAGITSFVIGLCAEGNPDYFTRAAPYENWIKDTIIRYPYYDY